MIITTALSTVINFQQLSTVIFFNCCHNLFVYLQSCYCLAWYRDFSCVIILLLPVYLIRISASITGNDKLLLLYMLSQGCWQDFIAEFLDEVKNECSCDALNPCDNCESPLSMILSSAKSNPWSSELQELTHSQLNRSTDSLSYDSQQSLVSNTLISHMSNRHTINTSDLLSLIIDVSTRFIILSSSSEHDFIMSNLITVQTI